MPGTRSLLVRLRDLRASGSAPLGELVRLVASELVAEVCSIYAQKPGDILELVATVGLNPDAIGHTRLRVGEGIVGLCAATGAVMNLPDAQNHPAFAYRPETGEEPYASMLAVPVRRAGRTLGVIAAQNRNPRHYTEEEVDEMETVAMLVAELLPASGATDGAPEGLAATVPRVFAGSSLTAGIAIGPVVLHGMPRVQVPLLAEDPMAELTRLHGASERMQRGLDELIKGNALDGGGDADAHASREVLDAYRLVASDAGWMHRVEEVIRTGVSAEAAVQRVAGDLHDRMRRVTDPYLRERLADIEDLAGRLLSALIGDVPRPEVPPGSILLARRLGPAELLDWHAQGIAGIAIEEGSPAGHAAILARALGIPAVGGVRGMLDTAEQGDEAIIDADEGQLVLRPEADVREVYARALENQTTLQAGYATLRDKPGCTADGTRVELMLNAGLALELAQLDSTGADGIGLFRTEIAMMARGSVADVAEQAALYARVLDAAGDRPVVFRTLDLGADKMLPGTISEEENPAMGWRSLRIGLDRPALLRRQLRALLLAAGGRPLTVMFPMVATVTEFRAARALLQAEARRVRPAPDRLSIGTMLEVPALMWQLPELLKEVDFVSVGSNDLLQFLFAADRGTPSLYARYDLLSQPVFDLLDQLLTAARAARNGAGVPLSICGEAASRPLEALALVGLGLTNLSMPAAGILPVKALLAQLDLTAFRPVLASIRRGGAGTASLREPIATWAREHGLPA
ncbi:MAG TPA: phosphoenolpyruvate--protein phosphotransferase [Acetobacteraceae bacterium]|nr:phosphoenolpyruvate--protein phosphotransferase [Acetobacteraceae bacterium]